MRNNSRWLAEFARPGTDEPPEPDSGGVLDVSVIVPTRNEAGNVPVLVDRLQDVLHRAGLRAEVIFVDDSSDETPRVVEHCSERASVPVRLLHREPGDRAGGLGGAVVAGLAAARGTWAVVMDGDLQHPPEVVPQLLDVARQRGFGVVVATRYDGDGDAAGLSSPGRRFVSQAATFVARWAFPIRMRRVSDPMSGFFAVRRALVPIESLRPRGFKILLELLAHMPSAPVGETPFVFEERLAGESKASAREGLRFARHLVVLRVSTAAPWVWRVMRFAAVGATGLVINTALFATATARLGVPYLLAAILAMQLATAWNFALTERFVFRRRRSAGGRLSRAAGFFLTANAAFVLGGPILAVLVSGLHVPAVQANVISIAAMLLVRFVVADRFTWRVANSRRGRHSLGRPADRAPEVAAATRAES